MPPAKKVKTTNEPVSAPSALTAACAFLKSKKSEVLKDAIVHIDEEKYEASLPHFSSGSLIIDFLIGGKPNRLGVMPCPGFPRGRIIQVYGQPSAGKTTLALTASASVIRQGGTVCYIDYENAISIPYAKALGIPVGDESKFILAQPMTIEEGTDILNAMTMAGVDLVVVDSVGEGVFKAVREQAFNEDAKGAGIGAHARYWSEKLAEVRGYMNKSNTCLLGISQCRTNIKASTTGGELHMARGGQAWQFGSDVRIYLRVVKKEKGKIYDPLTHQSVEKTVATTVKAEIKKSRISGSQGMDADFHIRFGEGIDDIQSIIEVATAHGIISGSNWISWVRSDGSEIKVQGKEKFRAAVLAVPDAWQELRVAIMKKLAESASMEQKVQSPDDFIEIDEDEAIRPLDMVEEE